MKFSRKSIRRKRIEISYTVKKRGMPAHSPYKNIPLGLFLHYTLLRYSPVRVSI